MYFEREPKSASKPISFSYEYRGHALTFVTDAGVFSRGEMDSGTHILLNALPPLSGRVLDMGCGYGAVGVCVGKANAVDLLMTDVNLRALKLAKDNLEINGVAAAVLESDGLDGVSGTFDYIITNPPIRAGKAVVYRLFAQCARQLNLGGALYIVIRKQQGAKSAMKYLQTLFSFVLAVDKSGGFWVLECKGGER